MVGKSHLASEQGYTLLAMLFTTYLISSFFGSAPSALSYALMPEFGLSYAAAGLVMSIYMFPYALMQVPGGLLSDRCGPRRTLLLFLTISIVGNTAFWRAKSFEMLIMSRIVMGFGASIVYINALKLMETCLPPRNLAKGLGLLSAASPLGGFLAYFGFPFLHSMLDAWRPFYLGFIILMMGVVILDALLIKDLPRAGEALEVSPPGSSEIVKSVASNKLLLPLYIGYLISGFNWCFWLWMPKYLVDMKGFSYVEAGFITGIPTITSVAGCVLVGVVSDRLRRRKLPLAIFSALNALLLAIIVFLPGSTLLPLLVSCALYGITSTVWVLPYAMVAEVLPSNLSGVGLGLMNFLGYVGSIVMTPLFGALIDNTGSYTLPNQIVIAISLIVVFVYSVLVKETYKQP